MSEGATETADATSVYAAGVVPWHDAGDGVRVLVIHRGRHDDFSLPKGKVDPGETLPETAAREMWEETGLRVALGATLGFIEYDLPDGRHKEVHYWTAEITDDVFTGYRFEPNNEVDEVRWVPIDEARQLLTYARDRDVLDQFAERVERGLARTFAVLALRHAKAVPPLSWPGSDDSRPITGRGQEQADLLVPILASFAPARIITSNAVRCRATVAPFAMSSGVVPEVSSTISQSAYDEGDDDIEQVIAGVVEARSTTVLCSHSPVMPEIVRELARATGSPAGPLMRDSMLSTGECAIFHVSFDDPSRGIVATETQGPLV